MRESTRQQAREFGHYEVFEELGQGGIGVAYVARPTRGEHAGSYVCLKIMGREYQAARGDRRRQAIDSLRHEARVVSQLDHPNIARLLDSGAFNDVWFLAFELIEGANLGEILALLSLETALAHDHVRRIGIEVAAALQCAHEHDVLHRDIKPSNILVSTDGQVKLVDFGMAKANARHAADFTVGIGTPRYWAPEQIRQEAVTAQTDIYALGVVLYESLTTLHPFGNPDSVEFRKTVQRGIVQRDLRDFGVPGDLASIIECCLQVEPENRFQSAAALQVALRSGGKAAAFAYDMGEIAGAVRDAVDEAGVHGDKSQAGVEPGNDAHTLIADLHGQDTQHAPRHVLAETVRDSIPRAVHEDLRDAVMRDLSVLAKEASRHRPSHIGRRRNTTMMEAWPEPEQARAASLSVDTQLEGIAPRGRTATVMEGSAADVPAAIAEPVLKPATATKGNTRKRLAAAALVATLVVVAAITTTALRSDHAPLLRRQPAARQEQKPAQEQRQKQEQPLPQPAQQPAGPPQPDERVDVPTQSGPAANPMPPSTPAPHARPPKAKASPRPRVSIDPATRIASVAASGRRTKLPARKVDAADLIEVTVGLIPYGEVLIDGKPAGQAPVVVRLSPGPHHIVGRYQQMRQARSIVVTPETQRVVLDLRNAESPQ